jgi:hypothetical protein
MFKNITLALSFIMIAGVVVAGPYTEVGISGYCYYTGDPNSYAGDPNDIVLVDPNHIVTKNLIFRSWATKVHKYNPTDPNVIHPMWRTASNALGLPWKKEDSIHTVSLGEVNTDINPETLPGEIIIDFSEPNDIISNKSGYDFVVFENAFVIDDTNPSIGAIAGQMFAELAYVEVATTPDAFAGFPSVSLTPNRNGTHGSLEVSNVYNLAGKHSNNGINNCTGTPFDLSDLSDHPMVMSGEVDLNNIKYIRIVDIPGGGYYFDEANTAGYADPNTAPAYSIYEGDHPIYDAWVTTVSGGFDLEAVGVLNEQEFSADINLDGLVDMLDFALFASAWQANFGEANWIQRCNLAEPNDTVIDISDMTVFVNQWLSREKWYLP